MTPTPPTTPLPTASGTPEPSPTPEVEGFCYQDGDVNQNATITPQDAMLACMIFLAMYQPTDEGLCATDCNCDDSVTIEDGRRLFLNYLGTDFCGTQSEGVLKKVNVPILW